MPALFVGIFAFGVLLTWRSTAGVVFFCLCMPVLLLCILSAIRAWGSRGEPLLVAPNGQVIYNGAEKVPAGSARRVEVSESGDNESSSTYHVTVFLAEERQVSMPAPYFGELDDAWSAVWLASRLGELLGVPASVVTPNAVPKPANGKTEPS